MAPLKTERFEMRLDEGLIERIDRWRAGQSDLPSRGEAVRQLIDRGLGRDHEKTVAIDDAARLQLSLLCDIYRHLSVRGNNNPDLIMGSIYGGHTWALKWEMSALFHGHTDNYQTVIEVVDTLDMWIFIESALTKLGAAEKKRVLSEAGRASGASFTGYDTHSEIEHYGIAHFLVRDMGRFSRFKDRELDSHHPNKDRYWRMMSKFEPLRKTLVDGKELSAEELVGLLS